MIEGSYRSWDLYIPGQLVDGLQQKKENRFSLNGNGTMSGEYFIVPPCKYIYIYIYIYTHTHGERVN